MPYRKRGAFIIFLLKALLFILPPLIIFFIIWLRSNVVAIEYELGKLQDRRIELIEKRQELLARRAEICSALKVEYVAENRLGLSYPNREKVFFVKVVPSVRPYSARLDSYR
ncbi:MAG: hypothetical protein D6710_09025 [Nitrospirae bacterium]|nr:MAG: hypothetical protein D6710_09025 [Nitrospirota bacterium]